MNLPLFGFTVYETYLVHRLRGEINAKVDYKRGFSEEHKRQREFFSILAIAIIFTKYTSLIRISFEFNSKTRKAGRFSGFGHPNSQLKIRIEDRQQVMGCLRVTKCSPYKRDNFCSGSDIISQMSIKYFPQNVSPAKKAGYFLCGFCHLIVCELKAPMQAANYQSG